MAFDGVETMKILDFLKRNKSPKKAPLPPIRTVRPPGEVRAANRERLAREFEESGAFAVAEADEGPFMDTGSLELEGEAGDLANPYDTHTWEMDPEEGLRRVEDQNLVNRKQPKGAPGNPYDTIVKKKGWQ